MSRGLGCHQKIFKKYFMELSKNLVFKNMHHTSELFIFLETRSGPLWSQLVTINDYSLLFQDYLSDPDLSLEYQIARQRRKHKNIKNLNKQVHLSNILTSKNAIPRTNFKLTTQEMAKLTEDKKHNDDSRSMSVDESLKKLPHDSSRHGP